MENAIRPTASAKRGSSTFWVGIPNRLYRNRDRSGRIRRHQKKPRRVPIAGRRLHESVTVNNFVLEDPIESSARLGIEKGDWNEKMGIRKCSFQSCVRTSSCPFLQQIKENAGNPSIIGQFGVGFYSSFESSTFREHNRDASARTRDPLP